MLSQADQSGTLAEILVDDGKPVSVDMVMPQGQNFHSLIYRVFDVFHFQYSSANISPFHLVQPLFVIVP